MGSWVGCTMKGVGIERGSYVVRKVDSKDQLK